MTDDFPAHMGPSDAVMWGIEHDPVLRSNIVAVAVLDRAPDWERLWARLEHATRVVPRLRQRVVTPLLRVGPPRWVVDDEFDLCFHLRRMRAPDGGGLRAVLDIAEPMATEVFDEERPLWEFVLVEGLDGGRAALIQKVHHTVTDGVGGIRLLTTLVDAEPDAAAPEPAAEPPSGDGRARVVFREAVTDDLVEMARGVGRTAVSAGRAARAALTRPVDAAADVGRMAVSLGRLLAPAATPDSPLMLERSLKRRFACFDVPLEGLREAGHLGGGTLNDAFLAAVVEGLARYHRERGVPVSMLRVTMPINVRGPGDPEGGNRFVPARFELPADVHDPVLRTQVMGDTARRCRDEPANRFTEQLAIVFDRLPNAVTTAVFGGLLKGVDTVVTNVPGMPVPVYLAGSSVERFYALAPPSGAAVAVALLSHVDHACIGVTVDTAALADPDGLVEYLRAGFDDVLASVDQRAAAAF